MVTRRRGEGLTNSLINSLPFELHIPGYQYCGPGTRLQKRLARGDPGINLLDKACKEHDIAYSQHKDQEARHSADHILQEKAWQRVTSKDASFGEKSAAWFVTNAMKTKRKFGMGIKKRKVTFKGGFLKQIIAAVKNSNVGSNIGDAINIALGAAKQAIQRIGDKKNINVPRVIPVPKQGGFLPFLIPLFAGLSAMGALGGGAAGIAKAVNDAKAAKADLLEKQRHNKKMEDLASGKGYGGRKRHTGKAMYLRPYKIGRAMYLRPYKSGLGLYFKSKNY